MQLALYRSSFLPCWVQLLSWPFHHLSGNTEQWLNILTSHELQIRKTGVYAFFQRNTGHFLGIKHSLSEQLPSLEFITFTSQEIIKSHIDKSYYDLPKLVRGKYSNQHSLLLSSVDRLRKNFLHLRAKKVLQELSMQFSSEKWRKAFRTASVIRICLWSGFLSS